MRPETSKKDDVDSLASAAYAELHGLAQRFLGRERPDHTLQPTELVHEAWLRLARARDLSPEDRSHFMGLAATTMRRILVDHARARLAERRSADRSVPLIQEPAQTEEAREIESIDRALAKLETRDARMGRVVELRFFGGLSVEETAHAMGISARTVKREWRMARAWLHRDVTEEERGG